MSPSSEVGLLIPSGSGASDIYVIDPDRFRLYYDDKRSPRGGELDTVPIRLRHLFCVAISSKSDSI